MGHKAVRPVTNVVKKGIGQRIARSLHLITILIQEEVPVSNVGRAGIGQKIVRCLHQITLLIQEEGRLHQVPVINVVCLVTGQETVLLVKKQKYGTDGKSVMSGSL